MSTLHADLTEDNLHIPGYLDSVDPGAVGAGKYWIDSSGGTGAWVLKVRKEDDTGWEVVASALSDTFSQDVNLTGDISPSQITSDQNNYNPTGLSTASTLRLSTDASRNLTGLAGGADGRVLLIHNVGAQNLVLVDESGSSTEANRFALSGNVTLGADQGCILQYDNTSTRWRLASSGSGGGGGAATLTVEETDASPSVSTVDTLVVPEMSLTDNTGGTVTLKLPTFQHRWSADAGVTKDGGDLVNTWADQAPWGRKFHQPTATNQPLWVDNAIDSEDVIRFDGTDNYLVAGIDGTTLHAWSFAIVVKCLAAETTEGIFQWASALSSGTPYTTMQRFDNAGTPSTRWYFQGAFQATTITAHATNATRVYVVTYDGYTYTLSVDGAADITVTGLLGTTSRNGATSMWLGNGFNGYANVEIGDFWFAGNYAWTSTERAAISTALKAKYGIS